MINEHLVQQVRKGEVAIKYKGYKNILLLQEAIKIIFPGSYVPKGGDNYYCKSNAVQGEWCSYVFLPSGMVAIPLKDFFVQEEVSPFMQGYNETMEKLSNPKPKQEVDKVEGEWEKIMAELIDIRNKLYNDLPTGEINAWELLQQIKWHINTLDVFVSQWQSKVINQPNKQ